MKESRNFKIDVIKGLGITLVVWGHAVGVGNLVIYSFHMPLFFLLSGLFYKPKANFIKNRFKRLVVPFLAYNVLFVILSYLCGTFDVLCNNFSIFNISAFDGPTWFLVALFILSCIYWIIDRTINKKCLKVIVCCGIGLIGCYVKKPLPLYITQALCCLPFFALGNCFPKSILLTKSKYIGMCFLIYIGVLYYCFETNTRVDIYSLMFTGQPILFYIGAFSSIALVFALGFIDKKNGINKTLSVIGNNSLEIMALHYPFIALICTNIRSQFVFLGGVGEAIASHLITFLIVLYIPLFMVLGIKKYVTSIKEYEK